MRNHLSPFSPDVILSDKRGPERETHAWVWGLGKRLINERQVKLITSKSRNYSNPSYERQMEGREGEEGVEERDR